jgi:hypothetical protein
MKKTPILTSALASIDAAMMRAKHDSKGAETLLTQDLSDAMAFIIQAIEQIQGAREDAARMAGRVTLDTELLDMLAPDELTFPQFLALHPALERAFYRLELLDANGASATASDIQDAVVYGHLSAPGAARFTDEINAACDMLERGEE